MKSRRLLILWIIFALLLASRSFETILHPQFWAEDGPVWYQNAYTMSWRSLILPHYGYLQSVSRIIGLVAQIMPLAQAPAFFLMAAIAAQSLPAAYLASDRLATTLPTMQIGKWLGLLYIAIPNAMELQSNLTNTQWHLSVCSFLVLISPLPVSRKWLTFDIGVLLLSSLSGPFCLFLLPIAAWQLLEKSTRNAGLRLTIIITCSLIQTVCLIMTMSLSRSPAKLGASFLGFCRIFVTQIEIGSVFGYRILNHLMRIDFLHSAPSVFVLFFLGLLTAVASLAISESSLKKWSLFGSIVLAAALIKPQVATVVPQWPVMFAPGAGNRYFFIPMLVWICLLLSLIFKAQTKWGKILPAFFLVALPLGVAEDWFKGRQTPEDFTQKAIAFAAAPIGTSTQFAVQPPGFPPMNLTKH